MANIERPFPKPGKKPTAHEEGKAPRSETDADKKQAGESPDKHIDHTVGDGQGKSPGQDGKQATGGSVPAVEPTRQGDHPKGPADPQMQASGSKPSTAVGGIATTEQSSLAPSGEPVQHEPSTTPQPENGTGQPENGRPPEEQTEQAENGQPGNPPSQTSDRSPVDTPLSVDQVPQQRSAHEPNSDGAASASAHAQDSPPATEHAAQTEQPAAPPGKPESNGEDEEGFHNDTANDSPSDAPENEEASSNSLAGESSDTQTDNSVLDQDSSHVQQAIGRHVPEGRPTEPVAGEHREGDQKNQASEKGTEDLRGLSQSSEPTVVPLDTTRSDTDRSAGKSFSDSAQAPERPQVSAGSIKNATRPTVELPGSHAGTASDLHSGSKEERAGQVDSSIVNKKPVREVESGMPGRWNRELNNPESDTIYHVTNPNSGSKTTYETDGRSRVVLAEGPLSLPESPSPRNGYQQRVAGRSDRLPQDEGGHLFASSLGGIGEAINIVAMADQLNSAGQRRWYRMETAWRDHLRNGEQVDVRITPRYIEDSKRPASFNVEYSVAGASGNITPYLRSFENK